MRSDADCCGLSYRQSSKMASAQVVEEYNGLCGYCFTGNEKRRARGSSNLRQIPLKQPKTSPKRQIAVEYGDNTEILRAQPALTAQTNLSASIDMGKYLTFTESLFRVS